MKGKLKYFTAGLEPDDGTSYLKKFIGKNLSDALHNAQMIYERKVVFPQAGRRWADQVEDA